MTRPGIVGLSLLVLASSAPLSAQGPRPPEGPGLVFTNAETRVSSVRFRFTDDVQLAPERVRGAIALTGPPALRGVRSALDFLPGISAPDLVLFDPVTLQKDVVRLRRLYRRAGFPDARIDYEVDFDAAQNQIGITFVVDRGPPLLFGAIRPVFLDGDSADAVPDSVAAAAGAPLRSTERPVGWTDELEPQLERLLSTVQDARGDRFGERGRAEVEQRVSRWLRERGYPWASARLAPTDTIDYEVTADLLVRAGPRARVDGIVLEGARRLTEPVLRREVPLQVGDWYDAGAVSRGQTELYELDLIRRALGGLREGQPQDSTVTVVYRLDEASPRLVWGRLGWRSEAGLAGEAHWSHRDFLGGARTLTVSGAFETGWASLELARGQSVGLSVLARQPYLWHRSVSGTVSPFIRYRDDLRDRSLLFGLETALIYRARPFRTLTLQHEISRLRVDDAFQLLPIAELVATGDSAFAPVFVRSVFKLSGAFGTIDNRLDPQSGFVIEPNVSVTGPSRVSDIEYVRFAVDGMTAVPLSGGTRLILRGTGGRLIPFSESSPGEGEERTRAVAGLRSAMFTAGGTADVRGWGRGLLGTKMPEVEITEEGLVTSDRWIPVGGLSRLSGSAEVAVPMPLAGLPHRVFSFLDAGRVWSSDARFEPGDPELIDERWFYAVGGGLQLSTLFGPVRFGVGYKLNPSRIDLLSPADVVAALANGDGLEGLEERSLYRWHLHFSIGGGL